MGDETMYQRLEHLLQDVHDEHLLPQFRGLSVEELTDARVTEIRDSTIKESFKRAEEAGFSRHDLFVYLDCVEYLSFTAALSVGCINRAQKGLPYGPPDEREKDSEDLDSGLAASKTSLMGTSQGYLRIIEKDGFAKGLDEGAIAQIGEQAKNYFLRSHAYYKKDYPGSEAKVIEYAGQFSGEIIEAVRKLAA